MNIASVVKAKVILVGGNRDVSSNLRKNQWSVNIENIVT